MNLRNSPFMYLRPLRAAREENIFKIVSSARSLEPAPGRKTNGSKCIQLFACKYAWNVQPGKVSMTWKSILRKLMHAI